MAVIGDEIAGRAPANPRMDGAAHARRRLFTQTTSLEERLAKEATRLRKQAHGTPPGVSATSWFAKPAEPRQLLI